MRSGALEKGNGHGAGAAVRADDGADEADGQGLGVLRPEVSAVVYIFLEQRIGETGIAQGVRHVEVHAAALVDEFGETC